MLSGANGVHSQIELTVGARCSSGGRESTEGVMSESLAYSRAGSASSDTHALFGRTMGYVAATAGFFTVGATWDGICPAGGRS